MSALNPKRLLQLTLLFVLALSGRYVISYALPQTLKGVPEDAKVKVEHLPRSAPLNPDVVLEARGRVLLVSNDPEYLASDTPLPSALYRDEVEGGFRVFYHHANTMNEDLTVAVAVTNVSDETAVLYREGAGQGGNHYPDVAGQHALSRYLASRRDSEALALLPPGASVLVAPQVVAAGGTVSAFQDFTALRAPLEAGLSFSSFPSVSSSPGASSSSTPLPTDLPPAEVMASVIVYRKAAPPDPAALAVAPGSPPQPVAGTPYYSLHRGTFPHSDRHAELSLDPEQDTAILSLDSAAYGPYSSAMTGEYEVGRSAVDGLEGYINGNYGVLYSLRVHLGSQPARAPYAFLIQPSGGSGHYTAEINGDAVASPFVSHEDAWWFYSATSYGSGDSLLLETSLPGGSFGPQKFFFLSGSAPVPRPLTAGPP